MKKSSINYTQNDTVHNLLKIGAAACNVFNMYQKLPLHISLKGRKILIVGGGVIALRKIKSIIPTGADITVVAISPCKEIEQLSEQNRVKLFSRGYTSSDLKDVFLVIASTNDKGVNHQVTKDAKKLGALVLNIDKAEEGDCIFPAALKRGDITISVSTNGKSPGYAIWLRNQIASIISEKHVEIVQILANEREKLLTDGKCRSYNRKILNSRIEELLGKNIQKNGGVI